MKKILCALAALSMLVACSKNQETKIDPTSVSLNKHELSLTVGGTAKLEATVSPANASNKSLNWSSTAPTVATVDQNGTVTAIGEGQSSIIVTTVAGGKTDACIVTVERDLSLKGISITPKELTLKRSETASLSVVYTPEDAQNKTVSWTSGNPAVATVSAEGVVEAKAEGTTTITATAQDGGFTANCTVTVEPNDLKLYYTILYHWDEVYVDGESDQLSGTFDEDSDTRLLKFQSVITLASDGSDLYSMEEYEQELKPDGIYSHSTFFLCKNRKPLYEIHRKENYESVNSFQVRNGTAGILVSDFSFQQFYAIRVNSNGTIDKHNYTGEFTKVYENHCAVAPNGNLYVAAVVSDENYDYYQVLYELATDGSWKEVSREKGAPSGMKIEISENGDIYMMLMKPFYSPYYGYNAVVYKNGEEYSTLYSMGSGGVELGLSIAHDHIYAVIHDIDAQKAFEYRDGTLIRTLEFPEDQRLQGERSLYISSTGDVYLGTYHAIYRNDDILYTESDTWFNNFCIVE